MDRPGRPSRPASPRGAPLRAGAIALAGALVIAGVLWYAASAARSARERAAVPVAAADPGGPPPGARPTRPVSFEDGCMTSVCHTDHTAGPIVHPPADSGRCALCHAPDAGGHTFPRPDDLDAVCARCHPAAGRGHLHPPATGVRCADCHAPHTARVRPLIAGRGMADACGRCHGPAHGRHGGVGPDQARCDLCHAEHAPARGGGARTPHVLGTCTGCHDRPLTAGPLVTASHRDIPGACSACHDEHGPGATAGPGRPAAAACLRCHDDVRASLVPGSPDERITLDRCLACHDPHDGSRPAMLRAVAPDLCLACHDRPIARAAGGVVAGAKAAVTGAVLHGPMTDGRCGACHAGHGGVHSASRRIAPGAGAAGPGPDACFACHDRALTLGDGDRATDFRDGPRNLHRVHAVTADRPRPCTACHDPHAAASHHLIADAAPFDGSAWSMKLNFKPRADGGGCAPACHAPATYSRGGAASAPAPNGGGP